MYSYKLSLESRADLIRIYHYGIRTFGQKKADTYYDYLYEQFDNIAERPFSFPSAENIIPEYRKCVCGTNTIYFKIVNQIVEIQSIIGRQDLANLK